MPKKTKATALPPKPEATAANVEIEADTEQVKDVQFPAAVFVSGAPAGAKVKAKLAETTGRPTVIEPLSGTTPANADGDVNFPFRVTIKQAGSAVLEATVEDDKGTVYPSPTLAIDVLDPPPEVP